MGGSKRDFKGVWVPKEVWLSREISASEKLVFIEIHSLDNEFGCVADNDHFADMFGLSERTVQHIMKSLKEKGLIEIELNKRENSRVIRILGKYARLPEAEVAKIRALRIEIGRRMRVNDIHR